MENGKIDRKCQHETTSELQYCKDELKSKLTPLQYQVTQEKGTERPYSGKYCKMTEDGIYSCIVCGEELFSSETKYNSGCGWPAFWDVVDQNKVNFKKDLSHVGANLLLLTLKPHLARTEVSCAHCGAHLGHVFDDGPKPTGKRYCVNSAALNFKQTELCVNGDKKLLCTKNKEASSLDGSMCNEN